MCGIVGYTGTEKAKPKLLAGLSRLEYRGYDSAGMSLFDESGSIKTYKAKGRIAHLAKMVQKKGEAATCGIAHTRWATHGVPNDVNSHPHTTEKLSLVHNGIIENYLELKAFLEENGYTFVSETDTEIAAKMVDYYYEGNPKTAIINACKRFEGAYALGIIFNDYKNEIFATRLGSPLVVTKSEDGFYIASDMPASLEYTKDYFSLLEGEIAHLQSKDTVYFYKEDGQEIKKEIQTSTLKFEEAEKGEYDYYMLKEIYEQPKALKRTIFHRINDDFTPCFSADDISDDFFHSFRHIYIVGCGTAYYAATLGKEIIKRVAKINVSIEIASEFRYNPPILREHDLVMLVSQSGETADTLAALRLAKSKGVTTLAVVNVPGSAIALEADKVLQTYAGPEIAVASTKAFSVQLASMYLMAIKTAMVKGACTGQEGKTMLRQLRETVENMDEIFSLHDVCCDIAKEFSKAQSMFYIGRGYDASLSTEGALKLKEISYIHAEAYAAGELKHGTISLITEETPVIALVTDKRLAKKTISNMKEVKARGGKITAVCLDGIDIPKDAYDTLIPIKCKHTLFAPLYAIIPLQLLAYHTAVIKGCDVDKPRNLAKSVTVE